MLIILIPRVLTASIDQSGGLTFSLDRRNFFLGHKDREAVAETRSIASPARHFDHCLIHSFQGFNIMYECTDIITVARTQSDIS